MLIFWGGIIALGYNQVCSQILSLQNWLYPYAITLLNIFVLEINFDKSTIGLHLFLIFFILAKYLES